MNRFCNRFLVFCLVVIFLFSSLPVVLAADDTVAHEHLFVNGFCEASECSEYEAATLVTSENFSDLGLNESYIDYYAVSNGGQLYWFAQFVNGTSESVEQNKNANGVLLADIVVNKNVLTKSGDLNSNYSEFRVWDPIGNYSDYYNRYYGFFDGRNHTVSGLYINDGTKSNIGLFGHISKGTVKNIGVIDSYFYGNSYVGAIAGQYADHYEDPSPLYGVYNSSTVKASGNLVGGLVGYLYFYAEVINCYNVGKVSGAKQVGGLFGYAQIAGGSDNIITFENCYNIGQVKGSGAYVGGLSGEYEYPGSNVTKCCYYLEDCAKDGSGVIQKGIGYSAKGGSATDKESKMIPVTKEQVENGELAYLLQRGNTTPIWGQINKGEGAYPILTVDKNEQVLIAPNGAYSVMGRGDVNLDGIIDVTDYQAQISAVLRESDDETEVFKSDINEDGYINVIDVALLERMIHG